MWSSRPITRILLWFIFGIIISRYIQISEIGIISIIAATFLIFGLSIVITIKTTKYRQRWVNGLITSITISLLALLLCKLPIKKDQIRFPNSNNTYIGKIINNPVESTNSVKAIMKVSNFDNDTLLVSNTKILAYFKYDSIAPVLKYGDIITFSGTLRPPPGPQNPYEFNFRKYLYEKGIIAIVYINPDKSKILGFDPDNRIISIAGDVRNYLLNKLEEHGFKDDIYSVTAAILLGYDDNMETDLRKDFITAGAMHILCVSGLHVGIIYLVFNFVLKILPRKKAYVYVRAAILLLVVWTYAILTGLSPSVQRAGLMISVFIISNAFNRIRDSYNTLATSALILLVLNPQLLFNVGFQLSYAAVFGIITYHQPIYRSLFIKNKVIDSIWSITALSLSAQLGTFPIALYYFHFFPTWFWLTNLFTFPLSFLIITTGMTFIVLNFIPVISQIIGKLLYAMVFLLVRLVDATKHLPISGIHHIYLSPIMLVTIYIGLALTTIMLMQKNIRLLKALLISILLMVSFVTYHNFKTHFQQKLIVYNVFNHPVYEFVDGRDQLIVTDSIVVQNPGIIDYQIINSRSKWKISSMMSDISTLSSVNKPSIAVKDNFICFKNLQILLINDRKKFYPVKTKLHTDIIIFSGGKFNRLTYLDKAITTDLVIIDSNVPPWKSIEIMDWCTKNEIPYHCIRDSGAIVIDL